MRQVLAMSSVLFKELLRKKDFYVLFILMGVFLAFMASQSYFGIQGISRYVIDLGYSLAIFFSVIIAVVTAARQMPTELSSRTIYPLLAKPISRPMVIASKFFGSFFASVAAFSLFFGVFLFFYARSAVAGSYILLVQSYILGVLLMGLLTSFVIFLSNFLTLSANVVITLLCYAAIVNFSREIRGALILSKGILSAVNGFLYYILPHFEFYDLRKRVVHSWESLPLELLGSIALYTALYCCAILILSGALFKRRGL
jgi:Cu-processing system permease protein